MNFFLPLSATILFVYTVFTPQPSYAQPVTAKGASGMDEAQADFALDLLRKATSSNESIILSPFSIAVALSMTYAGAEGETKKQMTEVLARGQDGEQLNKYISSLLTDIANKHEGYTLDTANRLYTQQNFTLKEAYLKIIQSHYAGQLRQVDFREKKAVAKEINDWVEKTTRDKIKDLVSTDNIDEDTRLMLVNAVYFKGNWDKQFEKQLTKKKPFYSSPDEQKEVEMMAITAHFPYYEDDDVQVLGMPYTGNEVQMFIVLPREKFGLDALEKKLTGKQLLGYIQHCRDFKVQVEVPKFKMEKKLELVKALEAMGMKDAFSDIANFSGISDQPLYISDVIHKAFIEVNEEGTVAAAASAIGMRLRSAPSMQIPPTRFRADHPYLFTVMRHSTALLFGGRVV